MRRKSRQLFSVILPLLLSVVLQACSEDNPSGGNRSLTVEEPSAPETPSQEQPSQHTIAESVSEKEESEPLIASERYTYKPDFYAEPIPEEVKKRISGVSYPEGCAVPYGELRYLSVLYTDFDKKTQTGEIICNKGIAEDLLEIFYELYQAQYPIEQICLIDEYGGDDVLSMMDNNSSCFNYRVIAGSDKLSNHAMGLAVDINPFFNPYVRYRDGAVSVSPETAACYADRERDFFGKIDHDDLCYRVFTDHGFIWGGDWSSSKDYQHFEKIPETGERNNID